jgi:hypothetical protein
MFAASICRIHTISHKVFQNTCTKSFARRIHNENIIIIAESVLNCVLSIKAAELDVIADFLKQISPLIS